MPTRRDRSGSTWAPHEITPAFVTFRRWPSWAGRNPQLQLSERRAEAIPDVLLAQGVSPDRVVTLGRGEAQPVASIDSQSGRQANRRVEIVISDTRGGTVAETR